MPSRIYETAVSAGTVAGGGFTFFGSSYGFGVLEPIGVFLGGVASVGLLVLRIWMEVRGRGKK